MKLAFCAAALSLLLLSCSGGGHSSPTAVQNQLSVLVVLDSFTANGGILVATVSFDGQEIGRSDYSTIRGGCPTACLIQGTQNSLPSSGPHKVTVTILRQTLDVVSYDVKGTVFITSAAGDGTVPLPLQELSLKAGGTADYDITT